MTKKKQRYRLDVTEFGGHRYVNLNDWDALHYAARQLLKALKPVIKPARSTDDVVDAIAAVESALDPAAPRRD